MYERSGDSGAALALPWWLALAAVALAAAPPTSRGAGELPAAAGYLARLGDAGFGVPGRARFVVVAADGKRVIAATDSYGRIAAFDATTGARAWAVEHPADGVSCIALSPDGRRIAAAGGGTVALLRTDGGAVERSLTHLPAEALAFSPDGQRLLVGGSAGLTLLDLGGADPATAPLARRAGGAASAVAFSPDGAIVAAIGEGRVDLLDATTLATRRTLPADSGPESPVGFSPDGRLVAVGSRKSVTLFDAASGASIAAVDVPEARGLAFSLDGKRIYVAGVGAVLGLAAPSLATAARHEHPGKVFYDLAVARDGVVFAAADEARLARLDARTLARRDGAGHADETRSLAFARDGKTLASCDGGSVIVWNTATRRVVRVHPAEQGVAVVALADGRFAWTDGSAGGRLMAAQPRAAGVPKAIAGVRRRSHLAAPITGTGLAAWDLVTDEVRILDPSTGLERVTVPLEGGALEVAFSADGSRFAVVATAEQLVRCFTLRGKDVTCDWAVPNPGLAARAVAFSPDGKRVAASGARVRTDEAPGSLLVAAFDGSGREEWRIAAEPAIDAPYAAVDALAFSPDGSLLAGGRFDGRVLVWDAATGAPRWEASAGAPVFALAFSPDGKLLASGDDSGGVLLWDPSGPR